MVDLNEFRSRPWAEARKNSAADIAAGRIVPLAPIMEELRGVPNSWKHVWRNVSYNAGMRPSLAMQIHRDAIHEIVTRHHALNPRVFGSASREDDREPIRSKNSCSAPKAF
jgi:hypothetical protein